MMQLSKVVPEHTYTVKFDWVRRGFMLFGTYRDARLKRDMKIQSKCFWCKKQFLPQDLIAVASRLAKRNVLLCDHCAKEATSNAGGLIKGTGVRPGCPAE